MPGRRLPQEGLLHVSEGGFSRRCQPLDRTTELGRQQKLRLTLSLTGSSDSHHTVSMLRIRMPRTRVQRR